MLTVRSHSHGQQANGASHSSSSKFEVSKARLSKAVQVLCQKERERERGGEMVVGPQLVLSPAKRPTIGSGEQLIQCLRENVDDKGMGTLAAPLEGLQVGQQLAVLAQVWHARQQLSPDHDVVQRHAHPCPREGVPHVEGVSQEQDAGGWAWHGGQEAVGHAAEPSARYGDGKGATDVLCTEREVN